MSVSLILVVMLAIVGGYFAWYFYNADKKTLITQEEEIKEEVSDAPETPTKEELMEDVLRFNQYIRCSSMERYLVVSVETILDLLVDSLPVMNKNYPEMSFTQGLNDIFHKRLPDYVEIFVESTKEQREVATPALQVFLQKILIIAQKAKSMVDEDRIEDLESMSLFIQNELENL